MTNDSGILSDALSRSRTWTRLKRTACDALWATWTDVNAISNAVAYNWPRPQWWWPVLALRHADTTPSSVWAHQKHADDVV